MLRVVQYSDKFMRGHFIVLFSHYNTEQKHNNKEQSKAMRNFKKPCINLSEYWTSMGISLGLTPGKANDETAYYIEGLFSVEPLKLIQPDYLPHCAVSAYCTTASTRSHNHMLVMSHTPYEPYVGILMSHRIFLVYSGVGLIVYETTEYLIMRRPRGPTIKSYLIPWVMVQYGRPNMTKWYEF